MRRALEPVRATRGPKELCQLPVGQSLEVQKGQGLEIRTLPQQSHCVPTGHPKAVTAGGGCSKGPLQRQSPVLLWLLPELCTLLLPQLALCAREGAK